MQQENMETNNEVQERSDEFLVSIFTSNLFDKNTRTQIGSASRMQLITLGEFSNQIGNLTSI